MNFIFKCVNMKNDILFATFLRCIINYSTLFFRSFSFDKKTAKYCSNLHLLSSVIQQASAVMEILPC